MYIGYEEDLQYAQKVAELSDGKGLSQGELLREITGKNQIKGSARLKKVYNFITKS